MRRLAMKKAISTTICGLLWLAISGVGFATNLTINSYNFSADNDGGGFVAYLNGNTSDPLEVFCVDYLNSVDPGPTETYPVNIDTPNLSAPDDGLGDTRYGTTTTFSWNSVSGSTISASGDEFGDAYDRYVMAAWLTTQYNLSQPNSEQNDGIQSAIWTLLDVDGETFNMGDVATWLQNAVNFMSNTEEFNAFAADVRIYSTAEISGDNDLNLDCGDNRYSIGYQEMIGVVATPEPAGLSLVGCGLVLIGVLRRRRG